MNKMILKSVIIIFSKLYIKLQISKLKIAVFVMIKLKKQL